jgi:hypothetical protein
MVVQQSEDAVAGLDKEGAELDVISDHSTGPEQESFLIFVRYRVLVHFTPCILFCPARQGQKFRVHFDGEV